MNKYEFEIKMSVQNCFYSNDKFEILKEKKCNNKREGMFLIGVYLFS